MSDRDTVASLAVSLDGYVAEDDGGVAFLDRFPADSFGVDPFAEFLPTIGALVMGSTSYLQAVDWGWMWVDYPTMVLTTRSDLPVPDGADVRFSSDPTAEAIRSFSAETPKRLWVFGGGSVVTEGLIGGAVDVLDIAVMPIAVGSGYPLFTRPYPGPMRLVESSAYTNGAIRLVYDTRPV